MAQASTLLAATRATPAAKSETRAAASAFCTVPEERARVFGPEVTMRRARAILASCRQWVNGTQLTYYGFKRGDPVPAAWHGSTQAQQSMDEAFQTWAELGIGMSFRRVMSAEEAMVRIGFSPHDGSWSPIGRDVLKSRDPLLRTINLAAPLHTAQGRDLALHEIGHLVGLEHEHQHPAADIRWNRKAVIEHFCRPPHQWSEAQVERNLLCRLDASQVKSAQWDPDSVMQFAIAPEWVEPSVRASAGIHPKGGLSYADKAWVVETYPSVRAPPTASLKVGASQLLKLRAGETRNFDFVPTRTRSYCISTFGTCDGVAVLFEVEGDGDAARHIALAGDDDSGEARNLALQVPLVRGRRYLIGLRLFHAESAAEAALLIW